MGQVFEFSVYHLMDPAGEKLFTHRIETFKNGVLK